MVFLKYIYYALLLSGFILLLVRWKKLDRSLHWLFPLYFCTIIAEVTSDAYKIFYPYHINQTIECLSLCMFYYWLFKKQFNRTIVIAGFGIYLLFFLYYFVYKSDNFFVYNPIDLVVEGIVISIFSVLFLTELYQNNEVIILKRNSHFWITIANLFFFSGSLVVMGFLHYLNHHDKKLYVQVAYIPYFLNLLLYSLYIKALTCPIPQKKYN